MKILYISPNSPFESYSGSHQRTNLLFTALSNKYQVDLACFNSGSDVLRPFKSSNVNVVCWYKIPINKRSILSRITRLIRANNPYYFWNINLQIQQQINYLLKLNHYDFIVVRYLSFAAQCGLEFNKRVIIDIDDLPEQELYSKLSLLPLNSFKRICYYYLYQKAKIHTHKIQSMVYKSFIPNPDQCLQSNVVYLPNIPFNCIPCKEQASGFTILFVGLMSWDPNSEGLNIFIQNCWDNIKKNVPSAKLKIVGKGLDDFYKEKWSCFDGIELVGYVENLDEVYEQAKVVIAPIYSGAGTNIKVLEGMSRNKALVVSPFAVRGLERVAIDAYNICVANTLTDFHEKVTLLLLNDEFNERISQNAYTTVTEEFSFELFNKIVIDALES